jgi:hypothetical protein
VDVENGFEPYYVVSPEKRKVVAEMRASLKNATEVYLATDEDREGEAIAWHLLEVLKQRLLARCGQHGHTVLLSFAVADGDLVAIQEDEGGPTDQVKQLRHRSALHEDRERAAACLGRAPAGRGRGRF